MKPIKKTKWKLERKKKQRKESFSFTQNERDNGLMVWLGLPILDDGHGAGKTENEWVFGVSSSYKREWEVGVRNEMKN